MKRCWNAVTLKGLREMNWDKGICTAEAHIYWGETHTYSAQWCQINCLCPKHSSKPNSDMSGILKKTKNNHIALCKTLSVIFTWHSISSGRKYDQGKDWADALISVLECIWSKEHATVKCTPCSISTLKRLTGCQSSSQQILGVKLFKVVF